MAEGRLLAVSDLHLGIAENQSVLDDLRPTGPDDWLIVAGDVAEQVRAVEATLRFLAGRFAKVIWTPGNHELWTTPQDPVALAAPARYRELVERCRALGVVTPEDPFPVWTGPGGPCAIAPVFTLYDYSFRVPGAADKQQSLARAHEAGVVCTDEYRIDPAPYPGIDDWCRERVEATEKALSAHDPELPLVLVGHWPLDRRPTDILRYPEFAQWCGTELTADWHRRFNVAAVVYGHLHIPRTTWYEDVRFEEVSLGYPREWRRRGHPRGLLRQILPYPGPPEQPVPATSPAPPPAAT
ncbi:metallophosphoesterase family protein [Kitasatospora sp. NPDC088391]|uniref:metallophosphoesterase family protein n=1 Tax=Kitasatospora sp. NPDC088391 TaxID=3364074 RepID=UPI0038108EFC